MTNDITEIFTPKPASDIAADMIELIRGSTDRLTDFNIGSVVRTLLEAHAEELDDYYQAVYYGLLKAIPTAIYVGFGFEIIPATAASGYVVFTRRGDVGTDLAIPVNTPLIANNGMRFVTQLPMAMPAGDEHATVLARAVLAGSASNVPAQSLALSDTNLGTAVSATNPLDMAGGADAESEDQRAERFAEFIRSLARGTIAAVQYAAKLVAVTDVDGVVIERVRRQSVYEEPGHVMLYVDNGAWGMSNTLLAMAQAAVDGYRDADTLQWVGGYRPAGMRVEVVAMTRQAFDVTIEIRPEATADTAAIELDLRARLGTFLANVLPLQTLRMIDIVNVALAVDGIRDVTVIEPSANSVAPSNTVLYLRYLVITWIG